MKCKLLFSGISGQGISTIGEILRDSAFKSNYYVNYLTFYGQPEHNGRVMCSISISDEEVTPTISGVDVMLIMDEGSLDDYQKLMAKDGTLILNSSTINIEPTCRCGSVHKFPFCKIAEEAAAPQSANMVALGYIAKLLPMIPYEWLTTELEAAFVKKPELIAVNLEAMKRGYELMFNEQN